MDDEVAVKAHRNWWKIGFFVMLFLFECAREVAVAESNEPPKISASSFVGETGGFVSATGRWKRTNEGSKLLPGSVRIECWQPEGRCREISYSFFRGYVGAPELETFDAKFTDDAVTYENDVPKCARYFVRIDLKLEKVNALRTRKEDATDPRCKDLEARIESTLADGFEFYDPTADHFLPLFWVLKKALGN